MAGIDSTVKRGRPGPWVEMGSERTTEPRGESNPDGGRPGYLELTLDEVERLANAAQLGEGLEAILGRWVERGDLVAATYWVKTLTGWWKPTESPGSAPKWSGPERDRLERPASPGVDSIATVDRSWVAFSIGAGGDEAIRLIVQPADESDLFRPLPSSTFSFLSLFATHYASDPDVGVARDPTRIDELSRHLLDAATTLLPPEVRDLFPEFVGRSRSLFRSLQLIDRAAPKDVSILIHGESGTGKELVGRAIHRLSSRVNGPFVHESCAAFSETLLESELFGHEKGAFTGAAQRRQGLIERAEGGTLFLDEVGEMSPALQSKLLRVLQEREVRRVGGGEPNPVDFRLITATHRDLEAEVRAGRFRSDLLYRIRVVNIPLPPLRDRVEDIPILVDRFLSEMCEHHGIAKPRVHRDAMKLLCRHRWPGNIRELRNEIERVVTLTDGEIRASDLSRRLQEDPVRTALAGRVRAKYGSNLDGLERLVLGGVIRDVLDETCGNKSEAARILGIPKSNLYRRLRKYALD